MTKNKAIIALGASEGVDLCSVYDTIVSVSEVLPTKQCEIVGASRIYRTPCYPRGMGPDFYNRVVEVHTALPAPELMQVLHSIEEEYGRTREVRWAGRTLDLDLLAYEQEVSPSLETYMRWVNLPLELQMKEAPKELILPHPRLQDRGFLLIPLCDFKPEWLHPVLRQTALELRDALPKEQFEGVKAVEKG